jgi:phage terminase large subunit GpA-like protein
VIAARPELGSASARAAEVERRVIRFTFQPPPRMTVTEWADSFRYLSPESSAEIGKYSSSRAPYQREPMNALSDPRVKRVVLMWPSQVGKTEIMNNFIGKRIHLEPGPMLVLQPSANPMAEAWSKDRLVPMLRDTPVLRGKVKDVRSRDSNNTLMHKKFPGGHLTIAGANSPSGLASRPIRDILCDEVDRYPASAGNEGDPIGLAFRRGATFRNGKQLLISSPTIKGSSRIETEYENSTQEKWWVPCPHCGVEQILRWGGRDTSFGIKWESGKPETAHYCCEHCAVVIEEAWKSWMNERGRWIADNPGHPVRGFWTNALISPWAKWGDLAAEWLAVKGDPIRLRPFVNTVLCETWEDEGAKLDAHVLFQRLEEYEAEVPAGVGILTCGVDVQGDRLEASVWGWGDREEGWFIETQFIPGDPATPAPWAALDAYLKRTFLHESGARLGISATLVDSGGHHTKEVYSFTREHVLQKVFACKGSSIEGHPLLGRPSRSNSAKAILYMVGSFTGKETVMNRFAKIVEPGPGYLHLPATLDGEQLQQFTAEKLVSKIVGGRAKRIFITTGRNEQLDMLVYALAALHTHGVAVTRTIGDRVLELAKRGEARAVAAAESEGEEAPPPPKPQKRRGGRGYVQGWRG